MNTQKSEDGKLCGAKTRAGTPCRRAAMPNGRCLNHGGKSPIWFGHPNYKHGRYSKYSMIPVFEKELKMRKRLDAAIFKARAKMKEKLRRDLTLKEHLLLLKEVKAKFYEKKQNR